MYRVLHNLYMDAMRKKCRAKETEIPSEDVFPDRQGSIEKGIEQMDRRRQVAAALARLDEDFRLPVMLCDMEGLAYDDIARILQCPVGTVRSRIHRGRERLRQWLRINASEVCL
jgi:RNA polymerase sigma-70 factor (ECF subfamily)